jgi:1-phosphofructokinase family hexose kinase
MQHRLPTTDYRLLIVNLNLAVDHVVEVASLRAGYVHRSARSVRSAGGKGVNVARALGTLGVPCVVAGLLGGRAGDEIARGLRAEGIALSFTRVQDESRTCLILDDPATRQQTVLNEPGPEVTHAETARFLARFRGLLCGASAVVLMGSLPQGAADDTYATLIDAARRAGKRTFVDTSGTPLGLALAARPDWAKVNRDEVAALLGRRVDDADAARAAGRLRELGAARSIVTLGARGAVLACEEGAFRVEPPEIAARNAVGAGDAAMAGLVAGVLGGLSSEESGRLAVATGTAASLHGFGRCARRDVDEILGRVRLSTTGPSSPDARHSR